MRRVKVLKALSGEAATTQTIETFTTEVNIIIDGVMHSVAYIDTMEMEVDGTSPAVQDQCGRTEVFSLGDSNWVLTISGYVTAKEGGIAREDNQTALNLSHEKLKTLRQGSLVTIDSPLHHGSFIVQNIVVGMDSEVVTISTPQNTAGLEMEEHLAFAFNLQLKEVSPNA